MSAESPGMAKDHRENAAVDNGDDPIPPMLDRSLKAFRRDLPQLLKSHCGQWVAHRGDEIVGFGRTERELYKRCFGLGLKDDEFLVSRVSPEITDDQLTWSAACEHDS
jgi:hypothetical protein